LLLAAILIFGLSAEAFAADMSITQNPQSATYHVGDAPVPLTAAITGVPGGCTVEWTWYRDSQKMDESEVSTYQTDSASYLSDVTPDTSSAGTAEYRPVAKVISMRGGETYLDNFDAATIAVMERAEPPQARFKVRKTDENGVALAGAVFRLAPEGRGLSGYEAISGTDGYAEFIVPGVTDGVFVLREETPPTDYVISDKTYRLWISYESIYFYNETDEPGDRDSDRYETVIFVNSKISGTSATQRFEVKKTDENGAPLAEAEFRLEGRSSQGEALAYEATSNSVGIASFDAESGAYTLYERAAPKDYNPSEETCFIQIREDGVFVGTGDDAARYETITFVNKKIPSLNKDDHFAYMTGYPDGTFGPGKNMTRAEAVVMFARLLCESMNSSADYRNSYYPDVQASAWYANQVCYMQQLGVLADYTRDGSFRPNEPVTRAEFATLAAHFDNLALTASNNFNDVPNTHWAVKYINSAAQKGWIAGYPDGTFRPEAPIARAEVVTLVNRILNRAADQSYLTAHAAELPRNYSDITSAHWAYWTILEASTGHDFTRSDSSATESWINVYK
jgi:hypothetical protein